MAKEIILPKVDMVMETGTFVEWLKKEGETVSKGDPLFVIMTDKAAIECEAPASGILSGVTASPDDVIPVTTVIGYILEPGEAPVKAAPAVGAPAAPAAAVSAAPAPAPAAAPAEGSASFVETSAETILLRATPLARNIAREKGLDLAQVKGRGPGGRIYKSDVLLALEAAPAAEPAEKPAPPAGLPAERTVVPPARPAQGPTIPLPNAAVRERVPLKGIRAIAAQRLAYSAATSPHIYLDIDVDMSEMVRFRQKAGPAIEQKLQKKLSLTTLICMAVARLLPKHPYLNSSLAGDEIILWKDVHLGIATALEDDLIVPVVRHADSLSLFEFAAEMNRLLDAARARKLQPSELSGSTFTISNLGMFGINHFTAIINPPEAAILAVAKMTDTPVARDGQVAILPIINFNLGADHRINDGLRVARFLNDLKDALENPYLLF